MKHFTIITLTLLLTISSFAQDRPYFNVDKDLLLAQFDSKPDPDDIHAQAALGSMMQHPDLKGVKTYAVSGAIGEQGGLFLDSRKLFNAIFGKNWTAANEDWNQAVEDIVKEVLDILEDGGKVWVQEAGQSNITADWVAEILKTVPAETVKNNIIVVQHSKWNEDQATDADLAFVKEKTSYFSIDDGNALPTEEWGDRGPYTTPCYRNKDANWIIMAKNAPRKKIRNLWILADEVIDTNFPDGFKEEWSYFSTDGVDYSDCCENWWILNLGEKADTHEKFWARYLIRL